MSGQGIRRLRLQALAVRTLAPHPDEGVSRKQLLSAAAAASRGLQLRPALRLVLEKMASCYGEQELARGLMVWPSNTWLVEATGLAERTIRVAIGELVSLAVLEPVDSANRKRYARRDRSGKIIEAFGFNLGPLYARRHEFEGLILERQEAERHRGRLFDEITIERKACEALLDVCHVDLSTYAQALSALVQSLPRRSSCDDPAKSLCALRALRERLEAQLHKESGSGGANDRHKETNTNASIEVLQESNGDLEVRVIADACPALADFGEELRTAADIGRIGAKLRGAIGASRDAWDEIVKLTGVMRAGALVIYILQIHADDVASGRHQIKSPGGLFRAIGRRLQVNQGMLVAEYRALQLRKQRERMGVKP